MQWMSCVRGINQPIKAMGFAQKAINPEEVEYQGLKKYLRSYCEPSDQLAWRALGTSFAIEAFVVYLIWNGFGMLGWTLQALNTVRFFIQFHDMAHFSFFKSISLNRIFGTLIGVYVHFPFEAWRDGHNHHHKHFGNLDRLDLSQTILFTKRQYEGWPSSRRILVRILREPVVFFLFTSPLVWFVGLIITVAKRYGVFSKPFAAKVSSFIATFCIFPLFGVPGYKIMLSTIVAQILGTVLFHLQHSVNVAYRKRKDTWDFTRAALEGSTYLQIPLILQPFTAGIEYHHIHHLNTNVASYNIQQCHQQLDKTKGLEGGWDSYNINRVDSWLAIKSLANVMLDEDNQVLVPFSYGL